MTREELNRHIDLVKEVDRIRFRIEALQSAAEPGAQRLTGMPGGGGSGRTLEDASIRIAEEKTALREKLKELEESVSRVVQFADSIPDRDIQMAVRFKYIQWERNQRTGEAVFMTWEKIADIMGLGVDGLKKSVYRYIDACPECPACP